MAKQSAMPDQPGPADMAQDTRSAPLARLRAMSRLSPIVVVGVALTAAALAPGCWYLLRHPAEPAHTRGAADILAALDNGDEATAYALAKEIASRSAAQANDQSAASFVIGLVTLRRAQRTPGPTQSRIFDEAAKHLARAAELGFPAGHQAEGLLLLGESLLFSGQPEASRAPLRKALQLGLPRPNEASRLLALAYLDEPAAAPTIALDFIDRYLAQPGIDAPRRRAAELVRAETLLRLKKFRECQAALQPLLGEPSLGHQPALLHARLLIDQGKQQRTLAAISLGGEYQARADADFQQAIDQLRDLEARARHDHDTLAAVLYLTGVSLRGLGDTRAALDQFERCYRRYPGSAEGWAALVETASIRLQLHEDELALQSYAEALRINRQHSNAGHRWLSQAQFRDRLIKGFHALLEHKAFPAAITLAASIVPPIAADDALQLQAKAYQTWGRQLIADAANLDFVRAKAQQRLGRTKLRVAGRLYNELARRRFATRDYPADRWNAAQSCLEGQDYTAAIAYLQDFLSRAPRADRPAALLALGKALLAAGDYSQAIKVLDECVRRYPKDPAQFEARIVSSHAYLEQGQVAEAQRCLRENLDGALLAPSSKEWRESLFALARLLHQTANYAEAIPLLQEAIQRYPDAPQALDARYMRANALARLAAQYADQGDKELIEPTKERLRELSRRHYEQAAAGFDDVLARLHDRPAAASPARRVLVRASTFQRAAALIALQRYQQAVDLCMSALPRYQTAPESVAVYVQLAVCHRRLGNADQARTALALAKVALDRIGDDASLVAATGFGRAAWDSYLTWLRGLETI